MEAHHPDTSSPRAVAFLFLEKMNTFRPQPVDTTISTQPLFELSELFKHLKESSVLSAVDNMLKMMVDGVNAGLETPVITGTVNPKVWAVAYTIVFFPNSVFSVQNADTLALMEVAGPMLRSIHETAEQLCNSSDSTDITSLAEIIDPSDTNPFLEARELGKRMCRYLSTFKKWKIADEELLCKEFIKSLHITDRSLSNMQVNDPLRNRLQEQRNELLARLHQLDATGRQVNKYLLQAADMKSLSGPFDGLTNDQVAHNILLDPAFRVLGPSDKPKRNEFSAMRVHRILADDFLCMGKENMQKTPPDYRFFLSAVQQISTAVGKAVYGASWADPEQAAFQSTAEARMQSGEWGREDWRNLLTEVMESIRTGHQIWGMDPGEHPYVTRALIEQEIMGKWNPVGDMLMVIPQENLADGVVEALKYVANRASILQVGAARCRMADVIRLVRISGLEREANNFKEALGSRRIGLTRTKLWINSLVEGLMDNREEEGELLDKKAALRSLCHGSGPLFQDQCASLLSQGMVCLVAKGENGQEQSAQSLPETVEWLDSTIIKSLQIRFDHGVKSAITLSWLRGELKKRLGDDNTLVLDRVLESLGRAVDRIPEVPAIVCNEKYVQSIVSSIRTDLPPTFFLAQEKDRQDEEEKLVASWASSLYSLTRRDNTCYKKMVAPFKRLWLHVVTSEDESAALSASAKAAFLRDTGLYGEEVSKLLLEQTKALAGCLRRMAVLNQRVHFPRYKEMFAKSARDKMKEMRENEKKQRRMAKQK